MSLKSKKFPCGRMRMHEGKDGDKTKCDLILQMEEKSICVSCNCR